MNSRINQIAHQVAYELDDIPHSIYRAKRTSSIYLHFFERVGTLTIRDHFPKRKAMARLRWNILIGYKGKKRVKCGNRVVYYYNEHQVNDCISDICFAVDSYRRSCDNRPRR